MATSYGPLLSEVVVLLVGEKKSGKSSVGNIILGRRAFNQNTSRSSKKSSKNLGIQVAVVDTPGWSSNFPTPDVSKEFLRGLTLCHQVPPVILLVLPIPNPFGEEEWRAMEAQLQLFQTPIWHQAMVLFTRGDHLGGLNIQEYIRRQGLIVQWLLERCRNRYYVVNNQPGAQETELLLKILMIMGITKHPNSLQCSSHTQLRRDVSARIQGGRPIQQEKIEMTEMHDGRPGPRKQMSSRRQYAPAGFVVSSAGLKRPLSLVLLGRRKSGKSSAGNMILDREEFATDLKTTRCSAGHGQVSRWSVTVVDTPGWSMYSLADPKQVKEEMSLSPSLCPAKSKVTFLLVLPVDSFGEKDRKAVEKYLSLLGEEVWRSTVVLFTYGDVLRGQTVEEHILEKGEPLQWVLNRCNNQYHVFDSYKEDRTQVNELLELVEQL
ncbi:GTPase IMAP family member 8-like [Mugil cephalus]|uniref:GTPase IMAP family member 8-like n=1 Tax=Mugil cephalus TaxID=48193 RepID=UPI001FB768AC|nr:GTPase IMAP family member 8-like [Mugil cephalus]